MKKTILWILSAVVGIVCSLVILMISGTIHMHVSAGIVAGGVAANSGLREKLSLVCNENNINLILPDKKNCTDNAAMIGAQAYYEYLSGNTADMKLNAYATKSILGEKV